MKTKKEYIAPRLTVVSVKTERGYAASLTLLTLWALDYDSQQMESYQTANDWSSDSDNFWN